MAPAKSICLVLLTGLCATACAGDPQVEKQKYAASGDRYLAANQLPEAIIEYRNAVEKDPRDGEVRAKLADAYLRAGDASQAVQEYVRAADLRSDDINLALKAGGLLLLGGRFDDAKLWAEKVLAKQSNHLEAQILLANSLAGLKDLNAAVAEIEEAIRLDPDRAATYTNLGAFELRRGQIDSAERAFKKAVELDGRSSIAQLALANFYWSAGRSAEAEAALKRASELDAENPLVHRVLANFYLTANRPEDAERHLKKVLDLTKAPAATLALADFYLARKDHASASALLDTLAKTPETAGVATVRLAAIDRDLGRNDDAYGKLDRVLASDQTNLQALLVKTTFLLADRKTEAALANATLTTEKHPNSAAAFFILARVQAARFQPQAAIAAYQSVLQLNPRASDAKLAIARLQLAAGSKDASVSLAQETLGADPKNPDARLVLISGLLARGELQRAEKEIQALTARFPDAPAVHLQTGRLMAMQKNFAGARQHFERLLQLQPDSTEGFAGIVALDLIGKQYAQVRAAMDARLTLHPMDPALLMLGARAAIAMGDLNVAEERLRRVIELQPAQLAAYASLAQLYVKLGRLDKALTEFDQLANRESQPVSALTMAGIILDGQGKTAEAQERYERALQADPQAAVAANNLAWIYSQSGSKLDAALQLAKTAYGKLPDTPEVSHTLGVVYYKKDLLPDAIRTLKATVALNPTTAIYRFHLGMAYAKAGDALEATQQLTRALALKSDFDGASEARTMLTSLKGSTQPPSD